MMWWRRRKPRTFWQRGEDLAVKRLRREGYAILDRNVRLGRFEIDIIAREGDTLIFAEVRSRSASDPVPPEDSIGAVKRRHLLTAARLYLARLGADTPYYRFDVVSVVIPDRGKPLVTLLRDAFQSE